MAKPTKQNIKDTEIGLTHWWCGTEWKQLEEDEVEVSQEAMEASLYFGAYEEETLELLTFWRGYIASSLSETSAQPTVEDFILATYVVNKMEAEQQ